MWDGLADSTTTLNGDFDRYWNGQNDRRNFEKSVNGQMTDILFHTADFRRNHPAFPYDGAFEAWMVLDMTLPHRQAHIEAHLTVDFFDGGYHALLQRGENSREWTHYWPE